MEQEGRATNLPVVFNTNNGSTVDDSFVILPFVSANRRLEPG
jgi:hypothetical protein